MTFDPKLTPKKQITNLLIILFAGFSCAILLTLFFLYNYGSEGHYLLKNTLLSPEVLSQISLDTKNGQHASHAYLNKIEFSQQDIETKKRTTRAVNKKTYSKFYDMISSDKSLIDIPIDLMAAFNSMPVSSLVIMIQDLNKNVLEKNQLFQEVQFLYKGDYYRLELRDSSATNWIYFYHPHIYDDALLLFTSAES